MAIEVLDIVVRERGAVAASKNIGRIGATARNVAIGIAAFTAALAAAAAVAGTRAFIRLADEFTVINNSVKLVTNSQEELVRVQRQVFDIAQRTRAPLGETTNLFRKLAQTSDDLGISQQTVLETVETVGQTLAISGASAANAQAGLLQFSQALAGGILRAEEFNGIIENIPDLALAIARGLRDGAGVTIGEFRRMVIAGEVTSKDIVKALQNVGPQVNETFQNASRTVSQSFTTLNNAVTQAVGVIDQQFGITDKLSGAIINLATNLDDILLQALADFIDTTATVIDTVSDFIEVAEFLGVTGGRIAGTFNILASAISAVVSGIGTGFQTIRVSALAVVSALDLVQNALGLITDAEVEAGFARLAAATDDLTASATATEAKLQDLGQTALDELAASFENADPTVVSRATRGYGESARQAAADVRELAAAQRDLKESTGGGAGGGQSIIPEDVGPQLTPSSQIQEEINQGVTDGLFSSQEEMDAAAARFGKTFGDGMVENATRVSPEVEDILGRAVGTAVGGALDSLLGGESFDFAEAFGDILKDILTEKLTATLTQALVGSAGDGTAGSSTGGILGSLVGAVGGLFGGGSGAAGTTNAEGGGGTGGTTTSGGANTGAGLASLGVAAGLIAAGFAKSNTGVNRTAINSGVVQDVQATRGVVVGPQNIPIFQVGNAIADAFVPITSLTQDQNRLLAEILASVRSTGLGGGVGADLDSLLAAELNTSPSLP